VSLTELVVRLLEELVAEEEAERAPLGARLTAIEARLTAVEQAVGQ
jgi:hypothetical protein